MFLIAGLGNPGEKYENTWHNLGSLAVEGFKKENSFPDFIFSRKFNAEISDGVFEKEEITLAKPQTFMNNSGKAINSLKKIYKIKPENIIIIHDDIDLPFGKIRIAKNRGAAGHKGVESIIKETKTKDFIRIRIGILPKTGKPKNPENFVLKRFKKQDEKIVNEIIEKTIKAIETIFEEGLEKAMNEYNS